MIQAGQFDRLITLQSPTITRDEIGGVATTWGTVATVWAKRLGAKGREIYSANREIGAVEEVFHIRSFSAVAYILPTWRLIFNGQSYDVTAAVEVGRGELIAITCKLDSSNFALPQWSANSGLVDLAVSQIPEASNG